MEDTADLKSAASGHPGSSPGEATSGGSAGATPGPDRGRHILTDRQDLGQHIINFELTSNHYRSAAVALVTSDAPLEEKLAAAFGLLSDEE